MAPPGISGSTAAIFSWPIQNVSMSMRHGVLFARILLDVRFSLVRAFPLSHRPSSCIWVRAWNTFIICVSALHELSRPPKCAFAVLHSKLYRTQHHRSIGLHQQHMRNAVKDAANCFPSAIISGRSREKVYEFIGLQELYYVGSHGMDLAFPFKSGFDCLTDDQMENNVSLYQPASEFLPMIDEVFNSLIEKTKDIHGSKIENNKFCVSVHYRLVDKNVLEIRPTIRWNKGTAVEFLLESLNLNDSQAVLPIYIGDDRSDEDAFKVLRERNSGYGILVSSIPKETNAHFSLKDPSEVLVFLKSLVIWKQSQEVLQRST